MPITPTMKILRPAFALLWFAVAAHAAAQAYKCLDPHGKIEYRGSPCAASQTVEKTFNQTLVPNETERASRSAKAGLPPSSERENTPAASATRPEAGGVLAERHNTPHPSPVSATVSGGICTGPYSWDACRKLGIDSVVDCKRMDEDIVFRTSVLQSKRIQCRYSDEGRLHYP